jgi:hypothetical protein
LGTVRLFTPAQHRALHCDAVIVDTSRLVRPMVLRADAPADVVVDELLDRVVLMGKSVYAVRNRTFALLAGEHDGGFAVAPTEPFHAGVAGAIRDALARFGPVVDAGDVAAHATGLAPLLAYERGQLCFLDAPGTRAWRAIAGRRGLRIAAAAATHAPDPEVFVGELAMADWLAGPAEEATLDLDALSDLPEDELERLLEEQLDGWEDKV